MCMYVFLFTSLHNNSKFYTKEHKNIYFMFLLKMIFQNNFKKEKHMKRILLFIVLGIIASYTYAQNAEEGKEKVYIDYFSHSSNISKTMAEALRSKVIEGIHEMKRIILIDVDSDEALKKEALRRQQESAMGDVTARSEEMTTLGAKYLIQGQIASMTATQKKDSDGKIYYKGSVSYTLKVVDPSNGTLKGTKTFSHEGLTGGTGDTKEKAILETLDYVKYSMEDFVDEHFKMEGTIVQVEEVKKKKAKTVFIDLGTAKGIMKGQRLTVFAEMDIAGEISKVEIGQLNVKEVLSPNRSLCKVTKGDEEIFEKIQEGTKLIVVSRAKEFWEF